MTRTTYPYLHGCELGGITDYSDVPWDNWEKSARWDTAAMPGVTFDAKGFPQQNPNNYPTNICSFYFTEGPVAVMPTGNYYVKTDPTVTLTGFQCTVNQTGLTGAQIAAGLWKLTVTVSSGNQVLRCFLGGGAGTGTPMTHIRIRTDAGAGVPASIYLDDPVWRSTFLSAHANFGCIRFMDWMMTNDTYTYTGSPFNGAANPGAADIAAASLLSAWANRPTKDCFNWNDQNRRGVPVEVMVNLCNTLGCNGWFNPHYYSTSAYQTSLVQYIHDNLTPGLVAHFEHSNEVWNYQFGQTQFGVYQGQIKANASTSGYTAVGVDDNSNMLRDHGDRIKALATIVNGIYTDRPQDKRNVIAFQSAGPSTGTTKAEFNNTYLACDVYSPAPYFYANFDMTVDANWAALGDGTRGSTAWYAALKASCKTDLDSRIALTQAQVTYAHGKNLEFACYEGGQHLVNAAYTTELVAFNGSQAMGDLYTYYISALRGIPGIMFNWFSATGPWNTYGCWGLKQRATDADTPKFTAVNTDAANRTVQTVKRGSRKVTKF